MGIWDDINKIMNSINGEINKIENETDNFIKLNLIDKLLPYIDRLLFYEKEGLVKIIPDVEKTYSDLLNYRDIVIRDLLRSFYSDFMKRLMNGASINELLHTLRMIKFELDKLKSRSTVNNYYHQLYNSIQRTIKTLSDLPSNVDIPFLTQQVLGTLN